MDAIRDGWFSELSPMWPGQCLSLQYTDVLYKKRSQYQDILVLKTKSHGNVLILDGVIQLTERDEFAYQEMMAFLPVNSHPKPEKVLVIGGGDGGVVRELDRIPEVKSIVLCEIDEKVVEVSKAYLPGLARGFASPKLQLHIGDGFEFMKAQQGQFDVIITDSSDPTGPAVSLFKKEYFELMKSALRDGGIICSQGECLWLHLKLIHEMQDFCRELFPVVDYAYMAVPTYPSGQIGCMLCSTNPVTNFREPVRTYTDDQLASMSLRYYNSEIHRASFALPQFAKRALRNSVTNGVHS